MQNPQMMLQFQAFMNQQQKAGIQNTQATAAQAQAFLTA